MNNLECFKPKQMSEVLSEYDLTELICEDESGIYFISNQVQFETACMTAKNITGIKAKGMLTLAFLKEWVMGNWDRTQIEKTVCLLSRGLKERQGLGPCYEEVKP